jgi:uncharacterized protein YjbI with pentapeptide repeats
VPPRPRSSSASGASGVKAAGRVKEPAKPKPPVELKLADPADHDLVHEAHHDQLGFYDIDLSERVAEGVEFAQCRFRRADLSGSALDGLSLVDCLIEHSNWANLRSTGGRLLRTRIRESRMTGFTWLNAMVRDVTFEECRLDLSGWRFSDFSAVRFTDCNLARADFTGADLTGAQFVGCDLTGAQFDNAKMAGTRLRNCTLASIGGILSWRGAVVHEADLPALSYTLAHALGIRIDTD